MISKLSSIKTKLQQLKVIDKLTLLSYILFKLTTNIKISFRQKVKEFELSEYKIISSYGQFID